jgi:5'-nucleotidase
MVEVFNRLNIEASCLGNHDLDFGMEKMVELVAKTPKTKWMMTNLGIKPMDDNSIPDEEKRIGGLIRHYIIDDWNKTGLKIGLMALAEEDWLGIMSPAFDKELFYEHFIDCAKRMAHFFREGKQCDLVIALTHMRLPYD